MVVFIILLCVVISSIASKFNEESQKVFTILSVILLSLVMGMSYDCTDYFNYLVKYNYITEKEINFLAEDGGYSVLNLIFNTLGFKYDEFRFILDFILILVLLYVVHKILNETYTILPLFIIFPMAYDIVQVRNFILEVILFLGIYLNAKQDKDSLKILMICLAFALFFHKSAIFFMLVYPVRKLMNGNWSRGVVAFLMIIGLCMPIYADYILAYNMDVYYFASDIDNVGHYKYYALDEFENRHITSWAVTVMYMVVIYWFLKKIKYGGVKFNDFTIRYVTILFRLSIVMCILLPLFPLFQDLDRLVRDLTIPLYVLIILYTKQLRFFFNKVVSYVVLLIMACWVGYVKLYHGLPEIVWPLLDNNHFGDLLK